MMDLQNKTNPPTLAEIEAYVENPIFLQFCSQVKQTYQCRETLDFSACSWEPGWNVKFKKAGKTLCTIYPRKRYITVMVVVGRREKALVEAVLPSCTAALQDIYRRAKEGNGQRWLTADLEEEGSLYHDLLRLIEIRRHS